jgi:hypothetical protein
MKKLKTKALARRRRSKLPVTPPPASPATSELAQPEFDWLACYCSYCDGPIGADETVCWDVKEKGDLYHLECAEKKYKDDHEGVKKSPLLIPGYDYNRLCAINKAKES